MFKRGMKLKIKCKLGPKKGFRTFRGKIVSMTDYFIVVQGEKYRECFKFADFSCGAAVLI